MSPSSRNALNLGRSSVSPRCSSGQRRPLATRSSAARRLTLTPLVESDGVHAGTAVHVALRVSLPEGLHTQSNHPRDPTLIPTVLTFDAPEGVTVDEIVFPPLIDLKQAGQPEPAARRVRARVRDRRRD